MASINQIQPQAAPLDPVAAPMAPEPAAPAPVEPNINALPPEVADLLVVQAVGIGQPAAVHITEADKDNPNVQLIANAARDLPAAGLGLFATKTEGVLFNPSMVSPQEIAQAVKDGTISKLAVPLGQLEKAMADVQAPPAAGGATGQAATPPAPAGTQRQINSARIQNLKPLPPTGGSRAGQGIVNELTRPVV